MEVDKLRKCFLGGVTPSPPLKKILASAARNMSSNDVCPKRSKRLYRFREVVKHENNNNEIVEDVLKVA